MEARVGERKGDVLERRGSKRVYDLSVDFCRDMPTYYFYKSVFSPPMFTVFSQAEGTPLGPWTTDAYVTHVSFLTHIGTHVDAPRHFRTDGQYLHEIPADRWFGEGPVLSIPKGPREDITASDLEKTGMEVRRGDIVAINTGWHHRYTGPAADHDGAITYMEHGPGLCAESAQWLADHGIVTVMIDSPAIDSAAHMPYGDGTMQSHVVLFRYNIPAVEGLGGDLDLVTGKRCLLSCAPVRYVRGDAFPVRALAVPLD
jgi:kynurenine formamidase